MSLERLKWKDFRYWNQYGESVNPSSRGSPLSISFPWSIEELSPQEREGAIEVEIINMLSNPHSLEGGVEDANAYCLGHPERIQGEVRYPVQLYRIHRD